MKKFMTDIKTLAALLMAGAAFTACSSSDDNIIEQPQNPTEPKVYTMVIKASKGGDATTRALKPGTDSETGKNTVVACWSGTETIEVGQYNYSTDKYDIIGTATAAYSPNGNTTITAELDYAPDPDKDLNFFLGGSTPDYTGQVGLLTGTNSISEKYDYAMDGLGSGTYSVDEISKKITPGDYETLEFGAAQQAIIKFTLKDKANDAAISPSAFTVSDGTSTVELTSIPGTTYDANGDGVLYVAFPPGAENTTITLTATVGDDTYTYETATAKTFWRGQYYEITVKMTKQAAATTTVTWDETNVFIEANQNKTVDKSHTSGTFEGITISFSGTGNNSFFSPYNSMEYVATLFVQGNNSDSFTFTAPDGKQFTKIEIIDNSVAYFTAYGDWTKPDNKKIVWSGTASSTVTLGSSGSNTSCNSLKSIVFTLEDAPDPAETTVTWDFSKTGDLLVDLSSGYTNGNVSLSGEGYLSVEDDSGMIFNEGGSSFTFTFTAPSGKKFTSIVINGTVMLPDGDINNWAWSNVSGASSVEIYGATVGMESIVFTLVDE